MILHNVTAASTRYMGTPEQGAADRVDSNLAVPSCGIQEIMYVRPGIFAEAEAAFDTIHGRHQREHSPSWWSRYFAPFQMEVIPSTSAKGILIAEPAGKVSKSCANQDL
jgi:hypothetical protein